MVAVFIYSRRYGDQGPPISNPKNTEQFSISVPLGNGKFATRLSAFSRLADMQIKYIRGNGFNFQTNNGLMGNGLANNPLKIDTNWVEANFVNSKYWQFSQIGDPTDTDLTISGSYFSVTYPYGVEHYGAAVFAEGNGDLRILRHVTNGEDLRVTYATWKNYRKTDISTIRITDSVYEPPGLLPGEYIHNVYQMSSRAMLAEIWQGVTFKEFVFITLNGTSVDEYHTLLRLGNNPTSVFSGFGNLSAADRRRSFHSCNVIATILNGRRFVICLLPPGATGACKMQVAEVHANGAMFLVEGFTVQNTLGLRTNDWSTQILFNKAISYDINDLDRCFYFSDPNLTYSNISSWTGSSPFIRFSGQELPGEKLGIMLHMYAGCQYKSFYAGPCKAQYFYVMDIENKTVDPEPTTGYNRLYRSDPNPNLNGNIVSGPLTYAKDEHYYAQARTFHMLPTGDRIRLDGTAGSLDIRPYTALYPGAGNDITAAMSDNYFSSMYSAPAKGLTLQAPTPVLAGCAGILVHNHLMTTYSSTIAGMETGGAWTRLNGTRNDKAYKLLNTDGISFISTTGYHLSPDRGTVNFPLSIATFRSVAGDIFYHNACWSRFGNINKICDSTIDANLTVRGKYTIDPSVRAKMDAAIINYFNNNIPAGFTEIFGLNWLLVPGHMSVAKDHAFYKIMISFRTPDATDPQGYRFTGTYMLGGLVGATINVNGDGDCRFADINVGMLRLDKMQLVTVNPIVGTDEGRYRLNVAVMYKADAVNVILGGGFASANFGGGNHNGWVPHGIKTNYQNTDPTVIRFNGEIVDKITIHKTLGLGYVTNTLGMGAMYCFRPVNEETLLADASLGGPWVLGSARPAAGFNLTVSSPVEIYNQGLTHVLPIQTFDLTKIIPTSSTAHKNAHLYMYAILSNGNANLKVSYDPLPEHNAQLFLGHIQTSDTEITSITAETTSRWEIARPSVDPIGGALPVATGVPSSLGEDTIWANHVLQSNDATEYLWDSNDLYDTDGNYETTVIDSYWSTNAAGTDRVTTGAFSQNLWFIIKTQGPATMLQVNINSPSFNSGMFEVGTVENWVNIGLTAQPNGTKMGSYQIRLEDEFEMSFKNARYQNVTSMRAVNTDYVNDTGQLIAIAITIHNSDDHNQCQFLVEGEMVGFSDGYQSSGTGHWYPQIYAIIPPGQKYRLNGRPAHIGMWSELRPPL